jgi:hypothetical protein
VLRVCAASVSAVSFSAASPAVAKVIIDGFEVINIHQYHTRWAGSALHARDFAPCRT